MADAADFVLAVYNEQLRPLHDRQVSDSMLETALGWGDGAA